MPSSSVVCSPIAFPWEVVDMIRRYGSLLAEERTEPGSPCSLCLPEVSCRRISHGYFCAKLCLIAPRGPCPSGRIHRGIPAWGILAGVDRSCTAMHYEDWGAPDQDQKKKAWTFHIKNMQEFPACAAWKITTLAWGPWLPRWPLHVLHVVLLWADSLAPRMSRDWCTICSPCPSGFVAHNSDCILPWLPLQRLFWMFNKQLLYSWEIA